MSSGLGSAPPHPSPPGERRLLWVCIALVGLLSLWERWLPAPLHRTAEGRFVVDDPDGMYHLRRVERALQDEGTVAPTDDRINAPHGSAIPWPPYYDSFLAALAGVSLDESCSEPERRQRVETVGAAAPPVFGALTTVFVAAMAATLAGPPAAVAAGLLHATHGGAIGSSFAGQADHHAWVAMLLSVLMAIVVRGMVRIRDAGGVRLGFGAGLIAGLLLGSWVASLVFVLVVQSTLGLLLFAHARHPRRGLAGFGLSFHLAAFLVVLPAVLASPWRESHPWMVVNLSWFQPTLLALGALVFVPLLGERRPAHYPWKVAAALLVGGSLLFLFDLGPARGVREGFEWVSRADSFMAGIDESRPILGGAHGSWPLTLDLLGGGFLFLPFAWLGAILVARRGQDALLPLAVAAAVFLFQTLGQRRFADALAVPQCALIGWGIVASFRWKPSLEEKLLRAPWKRVAIHLPFALLPVTPDLLDSSLLIARKSPHLVGEYRTRAVYRELFEWIEEHTPDGSTVLADWSWGHALEWRADRASVATNFGSYVGEEGFLTPARFFTTSKPTVAEGLMESCGADYILVTDRFAGGFFHHLRLLGLEKADYLVRGNKGVDRPTSRYFETVGARLAHFDGAAIAPQLPSTTVEPLHGFRLLHVGPIHALGSHAKPGPAGRVFERVAGARLEANTQSGSLLEVEIVLQYPHGILSPEQGSHELVYRVAARADAGGVAAVRFPYATDAPNGDGVATGQAVRWRIDDGPWNAGSVPEKAVLLGATVPLL